MSEIQIREQLPNPYENPQQNYSDEDEISLIDLLAVIWHYKKMIVIITVGAALLSVLVSFISIKLGSKSFWPNTYSSKASAKITDYPSAASSAASTNSDLTNFYIGSTSFFDAISTGLDFENRYDMSKVEKKKSAMRAKVKNALDADFETKSKILTLTYTDTDPTLAYEAAKFAINWIKESLTENYKEDARRGLEEIETSLAQTTTQMREQLDYMQSLDETSISYTSAQTEYMTLRTSYSNLQNRRERILSYLENPPECLTILEMPEIAEKKSGPSRGKACIIVTFAAFFVSIFLAFAINAIQNIKNDPETMAKFK